MRNLLLGFAAALALCTHAQADSSYNQYSDPRFESFSKYTLECVSNPATVYSLGADNMHLTIEVNPADHYVALTNDHGTATYPITYASVSKNANGLFVAQVNFVTGRSPYGHVLVHTLNALNGYTQYNGEADVGGFFGFRCK
jgi:hypothetical protein